MTPTFFSSPVFGKLYQNIIVPVTHCPVRGAFFPGASPENRPLLRLFAQFEKLSPRQEDYELHTFELVCRIWRTILKQVDWKAPCLLYTSPRSRWFVLTSTPKPRAEGSSPSAPAKKPANTLGFRRFSFCMCCIVMWFTLVQTLAFSIRFYPFSTVLIPSSTQNAPGFAFFWLNRVRFPLFCCFSGAKFSCWFLCILPHSGYKLKPSVIPCRREVSFLT